MNSPGGAGQLSHRDAHFPGKAVDIVVFDGLDPSPTRTEAAPARFDSAEPPASTSIPDGVGGSMPRPPGQGRSGSRRKFDKHTTH